MDGALTRLLMAPGGPDLPTLDELVRRPAWMARAACRGVDRDLFFPTVGQPTAPAKAICATCIVRPDCLAYAMENPDLVGIWGGTSARERQRLRRALPAA